MAEPSHVPISIRFGPFEVLPDSGELSKHGIRLKLSGQAIQVLLALLEVPGSLVSREELQQKLWPGASFGDFDQGLNAAVNRLREVLGDSATEPTYIETLPRRGYRFIAPVCGTAVSGDALPTRPINAPEGSQAGGIVPLPPVQPIRSAVRQLGWSAALALVIALLVSAYWLFIARPPIRSVAVLPFSTSSKETEYLGDGISDSLIDSVSQLSELKVISHASAFHYKGKEVDPRAVGRELGVSAVLMGAVVSRGDTLSVRAELVDTKDNTRLWGAQYTRKMSDIVTIQRELSQEIGEQLRLHLSGEQKRRLSMVSTEDSDAYLLYLRGRYYWYKGTPEAYETARQYFEEAIEKHPAYALPYTGLTGYYFVLSDGGLTPTQEVIPKARAAAYKALKLDPNLGPAHNSLGGVMLYYDWDLFEAEREFKRAIELAPNFGSTYGNYANCLRAMGRLDEAIAAGRRRRELDPVSVSVNTSLGWTYYYTRRYTEAIEQFLTSITMDPSYLGAQFGLASAYQQNGMEKQAIQAWQTYITALGGSNLASELGKTYATSGYAAAMRMFQQKSLELNTEAAKGSYISPMIFAGLHAALGNKDQAFAWLDKAYAERSPKLLDLKLDPDFDSLREDPRYSDLVRRIRLP